MPGVTSSQSNPSWVPVPEQPLPQDTSFSPVTLTHFWLLHCPSAVQTHTPPAVQLGLPLQAPNGHDVYPEGPDVGQPPDGHGGAAST
jgi:hypothetical protein